MSLNMNDPYLRAERQPPSILALGTRLKQAYGVGADNFGCKGNEYHYSGYHRSRNFLLYSDSGNGGDYSTQGSKNQGGNGDNCCGWDLTPGVWGTSDNRRKMIEITKRLRAAARANDPRLAAYYEFAGTEDGSHVVTFYAQGGEAKDPFDSSHLDHVHGSKFRSMADNDDTGVGDIILGIGGVGEDDEMGSTYIGGIVPFDANPDDPFNVNVGIVEAGIADPRPAWLEFTNDGPGDYAVRVVWTTGDNVYHTLNFADVVGNFGYDGTVFKKGVRGWVQLPDACVSLAMYRKAVKDGRPVPPTTDNPIKGRYVGFAIERGAVGTH